MRDHGVPLLSTAQMREVDRAMIEDYRIGLVQMMENAGRNLAHLARVRYLCGDPVGKQVTVLAGSGGNGGGAMVCARRLHTWGADVTVFLTRPASSLSGVPAQQLDILTRMGVPTAQAVEAPAESADKALLIDGIIGDSLSGAPKGAAADLIRWANAQSRPVLALDVPSGLEATTGRALSPCIRATATMTLALPKQGLATAEARPYVGELYLADIGVPPALYELSSIGVHVEGLFGKDDVIRLW